MPLLIKNPDLSLMIYVLFLKSDMMSSSLYYRGRLKANLPVEYNLTFIFFFSRVRPFPGFHQSSLIDLKEEEKDFKSA